MRRAALMIAAATVLAYAPLPAAANGYGESLPWQFETPNELAAKAALLDIIEKKKAGGYGPASYSSSVYNNTNVGKQYNCSNNATSTGNNGVNSNTASSPSTTGASATSTGNSTTNSTGDSPILSGGTNSVSGSQKNNGDVSSGVHGGTSVSAGGGNDQALNSTQTNDGNQYAKVQSSTACEFDASATLNGDVSVGPINGPINVGVPLTGAH